MNFLSIHTTSFLRFEAITKTPKQKACLMSMVRLQMTLKNLSYHLEALPVRIN